LYCSHAVKDDVWIALVAQLNVTPLAWQQQQQQQQEHPDENQARSTQHTYNRG
jgi:hypothetical protein